MVGIIPAKDRIFDFGNSEYVIVDFFSSDGGCVHEDQAICSETVGNGALRTVRWHEGRPVDDGDVHGEVRALKAVVGEMVDQGGFDLPEAREYLIEKLTAWTDEEAELIVRTSD